MRQQARGIAAAARPEARAGRPGRPRVHRSVPPARARRQDCPICSGPISGTRSPPCGATAIIDQETHADLLEAYDFLRAVEGRLRLIKNRNVGTLPEAPADLERLARRLNYDPADSAHSVAAFLADVERFTARTRAIFDRIITSQAARLT